MKFSEFLRNMEDKDTAKSVYYVQHQVRKRYTSIYQEICIYIPFYNWKNNSYLRYYYSNRLQNGSLQTEFPQLMEDIAPDLDFVSRVLYPYSLPFLRLDH